MAAPLIPLLVEIARQLMEASRTEAAKDKAEAADDREAAIKRDERTRELEARTQEIETLKVACQAVLTSNAALKALLRRAHTELERSISSDKDTAAREALLADIKEVL